MAFLNKRAFTCTLCGERFTWLCGDLIIQESLICDACLAALWSLEGAALQQSITARLAARVSEEGDRAGAAAQPGPRAGQIAQYVVQLRRRWGAVEDLIQEREAGRRASAR